MTALRYALALVLVVLAMLLFAAPRLSQYDGARWLPAPLTQPSAWPRLAFVVLCVGGAAALARAAPWRRARWLACVALFTLAVLALTAKSHEQIELVDALLATVWVSGGTLLLSGLLRTDARLLREELAHPSTSRRLAALNDAQLLLKLRVLPTVEELEALAARGVRDPDDSVAQAGRALRATLGSVPVPAPERSPEGVASAPSAPLAPEQEPMAPPPGQAQPADDGAAQDEVDAEGDADDESSAGEEYWAQGDGEGEVQGEAAVAVALPKSVHERVAQLIAVLEQGQPRDCDQAIEDLVALGVPAIAPIAKGLTGASADVRVDLLRALSQLQD